MSLTGLAFLSAFVTGLALAVVRAPVFGLYVYVATFYLHPPSRWWGNDLPDLRWSLLAGLVTLAATLRLPADSERPSWITTTPAKLLIAYTVWVWVQNAWALDPSSHLDLSILFTKYVILYYLVYRLVNTPRQFTLFLLAHLAGCFYLAWLAFNARFTGRLEGVGGPGIDEANALGMTMATAAAVGAALMLRFRFRDWRCWIPILVMPWVLNALVLTGSRSSLLGLIAGGLTIWYLKPKGYGLKFYGFAALGLVLIGMLAHDQFLSRMRTITVAIDAPEELDLSAESRIELLKVQMEMAKTNPLGIGHRGTGVLAPRYLDTKYLTATREDPSTMSRTSHNTWMTVLVEQGLPGAIIYGWLLGWICVGARKLKRAGRVNPDSLVLLPAVGVVAAIAVTQVSGQFVDYLKAEVVIWFVALLANALHLERATIHEATVPRGTRLIAPIAARTTRSHS